MSKYKEKRKIDKSNKNILINVINKQEDDEQRVSLWLDVVEDRVLKWSVFSCDIFEISLVEQLVLVDS